MKNKLTVGKKYKVTDIQAKQGNKNEKNIKTGILVKKYKCFYLFESIKGYKFCILTRDLNKEYEVIEYKNWDGEIYE